MPGLLSEKLSMRYKLATNIVVKTENAAKPEKQGSAYLKSIISRLEPVSSSFDYGCGKLRYRDAILATTDTLAVIDSEVQLSRTQLIRGKLTTIREAARRTNRVSAFSTTEFGRLLTAFDRGFCINVLSVIPFLSARGRLLDLIRWRLRAGGTCLFTVQYRNSDFSRMRDMPNARPWLDGILVDSLRGYSFYGLISPERLAKMVERAGFEIVERTLNEGTVSLMARSLVKSKNLTSINIDEDRNFSFS